MSGLILFMTTQLSTDRHWLELDIAIGSAASGLSRAEFLREASLSEHGLSDSCNKENAVWNTATRLSGRADIGLDVLDHLHLDDLGEFGLAALTSNDLHGAILDLVTMSQLITSKWTYQYRDHPKRPSVEVHMTSEDENYCHQSFDSCIAIGVHFTKILLAKSRCGMSIYIKH
jgi:hypothetical protein